MSSVSAPVAPLPRHAVQVSRNVVRAGSTTRRFREGDARSLLTAYLALIRQLRDQRRARSIELRSTDIESLAAYLGRPGSEVVELLAEMMGATRSQRATMVALFGTGALVIGLAGSTAVGRAESAPSGVVASRAAAEAVMPEGATVATPTPTPAPAPATLSPATAPATTAPAPSVSPAMLPVASTTAAPTPSIAPAPPLVEEPPTIVDAAAPAPAPRPRTAQPVTADQDEASAPGDGAPDDAVVTDIGTPPVPPTTAAPDDTVVTDIGTPPVPPTTAAPDDTVVTDIGTPPVPPTTAAPDDTIVTDIGTPPVPPAGDDGTGTAAG